MHTPIQTSETSNHTLHTGYYPVLFRILRLNIRRQSVRSTEYPSRIDLLVVVHPSWVKSPSLSLRMLLNE